MKNVKGTQRGFTLVEIAIVLVIVGLLLAGVLKGQELIESTRIKNIMNDMNGLTSAVTSYQDRYRALPGDEALANYTGRGWTGFVTAGDGNGAIGAAGGAAAFTGAASENMEAMRALRAAGFISGDPAATGVAALPQHPAGGVFGLANGVYGMPGNAVCASILSHKFAGAIDRQLDDGVNNTGTVRGQLAAAPAAAAGAAVAFNETLATTFTLCRRL